MPGVIVVQDDEAYAHPDPLPLTPMYVPGSPAKLFVSDPTGILATLTTGSKTVTVRGPQRQFTEQKRAFTEDFGRTVSSGWGLSPGGGNWLNLTGTSANFSVNGTQGVILNDVANTGRYVSMNDGNVSDLDVTARVTLDKASAGASSSLAVTFGYTDSSNHYRARLTVTTSGNINLDLDSVVGGASTSLAATSSAGTGFTANQWWRIRVQRTGSLIRCRAWLDSNTEPSTWGISVTDSTWGAGRIGFRALASTGSTAVPFNTIVDTLTVNSILWADPPSVTHNTWVRVLPTAFNGVWTPALADQIRAWATDCTPDALAYAMMFVSGAPAVTDPALGYQVFGQALYGPTAADGTRVEFSDFNDYFGQNWTFANGETRTFPHVAVVSSGGIDCSGFVRMVYGYRMGIPMSFDLNFDGTNLPRRTADIGPSGPGVIVQQGVGVKPSLAGLQIGDLLLFDADASEPVEGQTDHVGIYLGRDAYGNYRFISSRKTVNGPTMSDVGGASTLNGTGTYSTRLRIIRRV
jgi:cell wall-associated NlpC family hydrolase